MKTLKNLFSFSNIIILIALAVLVFAGYSFFDKQALAPSSLDEKTETATTTSSVLIQVPTQTPGTLVSIDSVTLDAPGWVTIYDDVDGEPSSILGAFWFNKGTHTDIEVEVFVPMTAGKTYYATLRSDDGATEPNTAGTLIFDTKTDLPLTDTTTGEWIQTSFTVDSTGSRG